MKVLLIAYDNASYIHWFPLGLAYLASAMRNAGHEVTIYNQDVHHYPESHLIQYLKDNKFDAIGLGIIAGYYQYRKMIKISDAINSVPNRPPYILGGHGPSPDPEFFMKKTGADVVCIGEGEVTIVELLEAFEKKRELSSVDGIAYMEDDKLVKTPTRTLIQDVDSIALPAWDLFPMEHYVLTRIPNIGSSDRCLPMLSGRGCIFRCNFCYRMDKGFRPRSAKSIIEEIKILKEKYNVNCIDFSDELLMSSVARTRELCNAIIDAKLNIKWDCNGRLNFATPEILALMKKAGCVYINYGIECMDDEILKVMNKCLTVKQIITGIEATLAANISPGFNVIFGNIGEDKRTLQQGVDFLLKYDDGSEFRTIRPVTPYPGSDLFYYAIEKGMMKDSEDFYENKHTNSDLLAINFTKLSDEEFYKAIFEANKTLIDNYFEKKHKATIETARKLYFEQDASFRGFRQI
jgi:anaerobic magnesium-protoporphyrin IX monomethyl ester cyclase